MNKKTLFLTRKMNLKIHSFLKIFKDSRKSVSQSKVIFWIKYMLPLSIGKKRRILKESSLSSITTNMIVISIFNLI